MKIPNLVEFDFTVAQELSRSDEIRKRADEAKAKYRALHDKKAKGNLDTELNEHVSLVLSGQPFPDNDIEIELRKTMREWHVLDEAATAQAFRLNAAKKAAGKRLTEELKPEHDRLFKKLCASLTEAHATWKELHALKSGLHAQGGGYYSLFDADPTELLGSPSNKSSTFQGFMRDAAKLGYCKDLR